MGKPMVFPSSWFFPWRLQEPCTWWIGRKQPSCRRSSKCMYLTTRDLAQSIYSGFTHEKNMVIFHSYDELVWLVIGIMGIVMISRVMGVVRYSLVGGAISPSWKMMEWKSMGFRWHPIYEMENKIHVWNRQPDETERWYFLVTICYFSMASLKSWL